MSKIVFFVLFFSSHAFAAETQTILKVKCTPPAGFAGRAATVNGTLKLSKHPTYPAPAKQAKGEVTVLIGGSTQDPILNVKTKVSGQYDIVGGTEYTMLMSLPSDHSSIYLNLTEKNHSYVEYQGTQYLMNCAQ